MNRKDLYKKQINKHLLKLYNFQKKGCFFYPYSKKQVNYVNARWQEAVYTLALTYKNNEEIKQKIIEGIDFWCKIQNKKGNFTEYFKYEQSFSATAFSLNAIVSAIEIIGMKEKWRNHLIKAGKWLAKNNEIIFINQQAAATLALLKLSRLLNIKEFEIAAKKKLNFILKTQKAYYPEKKGFDLGYSTLTLDFLAEYYLITKDKRILISAEKFCKFLQNNKNIKNTRSETNWVIINGFEILALKSKIIKNTLRLCLENYDFIHIPNDRHIATDLYRICLAYKNTKAKFKEINFYNKFKKSKQKTPKRFLNLLRPFGLHKIRKIYYKLK